MIWEKDGIISNFRKFVHGAFSTLTLEALSIFYFGHKGSKSGVFLDEYSV